MKWLTHDSKCSGHVYHCLSLFCLPSKALTMVLTYHFYIQHGKEGHGKLCNVFTDLFNGALVRGGWGGGGEEWPVGCGGGV